MEIPPLPARTVPLADRRVIAALDHGDGMGDAQPASTAPPVAGGGISVVIGTHKPTGAIVTSMVDSDTGEVVAQIPPEQVLELVAHLIEQNHQRNEERNGHGEH